MRFGRNKDDPDLIISLMDRFHGASDQAYRAYISTHPDTLLSVQYFEELWDDELDLRSELAFYDKYESGKME